MAFENPILVFFFYAIGFTWAFDRVFGLQQSALARRTQA